MNKYELQLIDDMASFSQDPYNWVLYSFEWGKGELEGFDGPDEWQSGVLKYIGEQLKKGLITTHEAIQIAISSGHGIGKSCLVAWLILWSLSTFADTKGVVTANTETQLKTKTWSELAKWYNLFIAKHWFIKTATAIYSSDVNHKETWRFDMIPWSKEKTEAFAGLHNRGKRIVVIFDEASAIPDTIYEVTEGALTDEDTEIFWLCFGNPTRNIGRFKDCFGKYRHRWYTKQIDSRSVKFTNKQQIKKWVDDYGENSDFVKVRVRGVFPSQSILQLIPEDIVYAAAQREISVEHYNFAPVILSVDSAWCGGDEIVIGMRQGLYSRILKKYSKNDNDVVIATDLAEFEDKLKADAVFIDFGYGTGIYSVGKSFNREWILVNFAEEPEKEGCLNKRAEMWDDMRIWLKQGGKIENDQRLIYELVSQERIYRLDGKLQLVKKEDMEISPNRADQLALTFAHRVVKKKPMQRRPAGLEEGHKSCFRG